MTVRVVRRRDSAVGGRVGLPGEQLRRGHSRGRFLVRLSQTPLSCVLMCVPLTRDRARKPYGTAAIRSQAPEPESPLLGGEWGWERPPFSCRKTAPEVSACRTLPFRAGGRSRRRLAAANYPCGKASNRSPSDPAGGHGTVKPFVRVDLAVVPCHHSVMDPPRFRTRVRPRHRGLHGLRARGPMDRDRPRFIPLPRPAAPRHSAGVVARVFVARERCHSPSADRRYATTRN